MNLKNIASETFEWFWTLYCKCYDDPLSPLLKTYSPESLYSTFWKLISSDIRNRHPNIQDEPDENIHIVSLAISQDLTNIRFQVYCSPPGKHIITVTTLNYDLLTGELSGPVEMPPIE